MVTGAADRAADRVRLLVYAARARDAGWVYREMNVGHDPQVFDAEGTARLLMELAN